MIQKFICTDGTVYAKATGSEATIDEVIEFLEQFRGMYFWNGATGDVAFRLDGNTICCDSAEYQVKCAAEKDNTLSEFIREFFNSDAEYGTEQQWRKLYDDTTDAEVTEYRDAQESLDEFRIKGVLAICEEQIDYCNSRVDRAKQELAYYENAIYELQAAKNNILENIREYGECKDIDDEIPF